MAVLTAQGISSLAIELLTRSLVLPSTVSRIPGGEYTGPNGGTITVRVPQPGASRDQTNAGDELVADDVTEIPVDVSITNIYHLKNLTDQEMTYELEDFGRQVTRVQASAVATGAEDKLAAAMNGLTADATIAVDGSDIEAKILEAREFLGENDAPASDRFLAVSPSVATFLLEVDKFVKVNEAGGSQALRDAVLGRLYGFTIVESNGLTGGEAVAYHRSGFVFANRIPVIPRGATDAATANLQGIGMRQIFQYETKFGQDQSYLSTFGGAAAVVDHDGGSGSGTEAKRYWKLDTATS